MTAVTQSCSNNCYYAGIALKTTAAVAGIVFAVSSVALAVLLAAPALPAILVGVVTLAGFSVQSATIIAIFSMTLMAIALGATHQLQAPPDKKADDAPVPLTRSPEAEESSSEASSLASSRSSTPADEVEDLARRAAEIPVPAEEGEEENKLGNESDSQSAASTDSIVVSYSVSTPPPSAAAAAAVEVQAEKAEEEAASASSKPASPHTSRPATPKAEEPKLFDSETGLPLFGPSDAAALAAKLQEAPSSEVSRSVTPKAEEQNPSDSETGLLLGCDCSGCGTAQKESSSEANPPETPADSASSAALENQPDLEIAQVFRREQILTDKAVGATDRVPDLGFLSAVDSIGMGS